MNSYKPIIGLEIHVELKTKSKMFCGCPADHFGKKPNTLTCPVCLGLPGALPVPNRKAVEWTILLGKALNCQINKISKFDRKNYFYPDLPKGYQISQYDEPIAVGGQLQILNEKLQKETFRIRRVHLEEDTGKLLHVGADTLVDFNRSGVPLVEIVTEPDFDNAQSVKRFLEELQVIIRYLGISDADMEKGSMRLEPNISVMNISELKRRSPDKSAAANSQLPSYKVEVKNINSFRFVSRAIEYELNRQIAILQKGAVPKQETRGFDEKRGVTYSQRSKEQAHDYRYFPEPDIPPMVFENKLIESICSGMPELAGEKLERYISQLGLRYSEAFLLTRDRNLADFFERIIAKLKHQLSNLDTKDQRWEQTIANFIINKKISTSVSIEEFVKKAQQLLTPKKIDEKVLLVSIRDVVRMHPKAVKDYQKGKENALMFLVGQVMRKLKGRVDAKVVVLKLKTEISKLPIKY